MQRLKFHAWKNRCDDWLEELEEGIRKQDAFSVYRYARLLAGTGIGTKHRRFGQVRAYTPSQIEWAQGLARDDQREDWYCTHTRGKTFDKNTWNHRTLVTVKRRRCIERRLEQITLAL